MSPNLGPFSAAYSNSFSIYPYVSISAKNCFAIQISMAKSLIGRIIELTNKLKLMMEGVDEFYARAPTVLGGTKF